MSEYHENGLLSFACQIVPLGLPFYLLRSSASSSNTSDSSSSSKTGERSTSALTISTRPPSGSGTQETVYVLSIDPALDQLCRYHLKRFGPIWTEFLYQTRIITYAASTCIVLWGVSQVIHALKGNNTSSRNNGYDGNDGEGRNNVGQPDKRGSDNVQQDSEISSTEAKDHQANAQGNGKSSTSSASSVSKPAKSKSKSNSNGSSNKATSSSSSSSSKHKKSTRKDSKVKDNTDQLAELTEINAELVMTEVKTVAEATT
jgi:hypothetical protein